MAKQGEPFWLRNPQGTAWLFAAGLGALSVASLLFIPLPGAIGPAMGFGAPALILAVMNLLMPFDNDDDDF